MRPMLRNSRRTPSARRRRPTLEGLEDRRLLATFTVTNGGDADAGSLRAAIVAANDEAANPGEDTITFAPDVSQVTLSTDQLTLTGDVVIAGPAGGVTITRSTATDTPLFRIFEVATGVTATLENLTITGGRDGVGGGILNAGTLTVAACTLSGNSAGIGGGIDNTGTLTVVASTLSGNTAGIGGGIDNTGTLTVAACTLSGNTADLGGGISNGRTLTVVASTLSGNSADDGGGIFVITGGATLKNTIVANSPRGGDLYRYGGSIDGAHNLIEDVSGWTGLTDTVTGDPLLGPLQDNGGPTWTHALLPGSPAINAGDNLLNLDPDGNPLQYDQRGPDFPRIVGGTVDIGAFEVQNSPPEARDDDDYTTDEDTALTIAAPGVLGNDSDPDGNPLTAVLVANVPTAAGSVSLNADGSFTYTPAPNFNGTTSFTYKANDGSVDGNTATVTINVAAVNDAPLFLVGGPVTVAEDSDPYAATQVTGIDDGDREVVQALTFTVTNSNNALFSMQPTLSPAGVLSFTPAPDANGTVTVTVALTDDATAGGPALTTTKTFTITITAVDDAPTLTVPGVQETAEDIAVTILGLSVADVDVNEGTGEIKVTLSVASGMLSVAMGVAGGLTADQVTDNGTGTVVLQGPIGAVNATLAAGVTYLGNLNFNGTDTLSVVANDLGNTGSGGPLEALATVSIRVLSPAEQVAALRQRVLGLRDGGALNAGQATSLLAKLDQAAIALAAGQTKEAYTVIGAFLNEVEAYQSAGVLSAAQAEPLLVRARRLRQSLLIGGGF